MSVNTSYTIQMASKISGVGVHTIRAWEKRYKALVPCRDSAGHRTYTKTDIEKLMLLSELCLLGYTISKVANLSIAELKDQLRDLGKSDESLETHEFNLVKEKISIDASQSLGILLFALKAYKLDVMHQELSKLSPNISARDMALTILLPLSLEIKNLASKGLLNSIQEQTVVSFLRFHAGNALYSLSEMRERRAINVCVAGLDNYAFDLGSTIAGLLCNHYGFNYSFLGSGIPLEVLCDSLTFLDSRIILINANHASLGNGLAYVKSYLEKLLLKTSPLVEVLVCSQVSLEMEKISAKRLSVVNSYESLDEFLSKKTS
jgi:DNA-binding transcriptional MerR regulator